MSVKWIKIITDIFDDEKIKIIDTYPARDSVLVIWFKLLVLAGKSNNNGMLLMGNNIPYDIEMLAAIFNRDTKEVEYALTLFQKFNMVETFDEVLAITNWQTHQNIDGMEKIRLDNKKRQQKYRDQKKLALISNVTHNVTVTESNALEEEVEEEEEIDIIYTIVSYLNLKSSSNYKSTTQSTIDLVNERLSEGYIVNDFKTVIDKTCEAWLDNEFARNLRPLTLFGEKFESYLNMKIVKKKEPAKSNSNYDTRKPKSNEEILAALKAKNEKKNVSRET